MNVDEHARGRATAALSSTGAEQGLAGLAACPFEAGMRPLGLVSEAVIQSLAQPAPALCNGRHGWLWLGQPQLRLHAAQELLPRPAAGSAARVADLERALAGTGFSRGMLTDDKGISSMSPRHPCGP